MAYAPQSYRAEPERYRAQALRPYRNNACEIGLTTRYPEIRQRLVYRMRSHLGHYCDAVSEAFRWRAFSEGVGLAFLDSLQNVIASLRSSLLFP
jgi:glutamate synthase domain-containing protein 2